jgi:hypothetical protein
MPVNNDTNRASKRAAGWAFKNDGDRGRLSWRPLSSCQAAFGSRGKKSPAAGSVHSQRQDLFSGQWRACSTNQFVRFKQNVVVVGLLSGKKADSHKKRAEDQAYNDDLSVCAFVSVMK